MTTIEVQIKGGVSPIPVKVFIDNLDNQDDIRFTREMSFQENYNLPKGRYMITVSGMNPDKGQTAISVSGNFKTGPLPDAKQTSKNRFYSELFYIEV